MPLESEFAEHTLPVPDLGSALWSGTFLVQRVVACLREIGCEQGDTSELGSGGCHHVGGR